MATEAGGPRSESRIPRRVLESPLDFQPHLWPNYERLTATEREELRAMIGKIPGGSTSLELAWSACDGRRTLETLATLVALDSGTELEARGEEPGALSLERYLTLTAKLGLSEWIAVPATGRAVEHSR